MIHVSRCRAAASLVTGCLALLAASVAGAGPSWTQFGGPDRDFNVEGGRLATRWPESGPEQLWSRQLGEGHSSILYEDGKLYVGYRDGDDEVIASLDASNGKTLWEYKYAAPLFDSQTDQFGKGPNATPLIVGDRIYSVGFTSKLVCLNKTTGDPLWSHDLVAEYGGKQVYFGYSSSPIRYEDKVLVLVGGEKYGAMGFDLADGSLRWKTPPVDISYASPIIIDVSGQEQLVFMAPTEVVGIALEDGSIAWRHPHENQFQNNCQGPWWGDDDLLFVASQGDAGSRTLRLTRKEGKTLVEQVNSNLKMKIFHNSAVRLGNYIYGGSHDFLVAHNVKTGKTKWKERGFSEANVIHADGKMILLDEQGWLALASMTPKKLKVLAKHRLLEKPAWSAPTLAGSRLYVRGNGKIMALELGVDD